MHVTPPEAPPTSPASPSDPVGIARGLIAAALSRGASMPDMVALDLGGAWDALEEPTVLPAIVPAEDDLTIAATELLLRARIALRQAIPTIAPARRSLRLAQAIRHLDAALSRLDGWIDGGREEWR